MRNAYPHCRYDKGIKKIKPGRLAVYIVMVNMSKNTYQTSI